MNFLSAIGRKRKIVLSIFFGILSLLLSPYGITAILGQTRIDIPWALFLPILISMAYGWRFGLIAGLTGGVLFPFLLWANNGWANLSTAFVYLFFYAQIGLAYDKSIFIKLKKIPLRVFIVLGFNVVVFYVYYILLFNNILKLNPAIWVSNTIKHFPEKVLYGILLKNIINIIILTVISGTLIRLPLVRQLMGLPPRRGSQSNQKIFLITMLISIMVWLSFVGLDALLFEDRDTLLHQHALLSLLVFVASGFIVSRIVFNYAENQFKMQNRLHKSEEKYRSIFENTNDSILIIDGENYVDCNPVTLSTFRCTKDDIIGKSPFDFSPAYQSDGTLSTEKAIPYKNAALNGKPVRFEWQHLRSDGTTFDAEVSLNRFKVSRKVLLQAIIRDISDRKRFENELIRAKEQAEESDRLKSTFLANMSHEIRTPLNSIIGFTELLADDEYSDEQRLQFTRMINESGHNLLTIISDIMDISKIEAGQLLIQKQQFSVNRLLSLIQEEYSFKAKMKELDLRLAPTNPQNEILIESDSGRLKQVLVNLVSNSIKFTKQGFIEMGLSVSGEFVEFYVKDTGIGIKPESHDKIFERFQQVESAYTRKYGGNGLGLPISKSLVELLGGTIWMESEEGHGSTFYFTVPK